MMMTKVWPMATASSGQTLESWLLRVAGAGEVGEEDRHHDEIGDGQIEDEIFGKQQAPRKTGNPASAGRLASCSAMPRSAALEDGLICHGRFPRATASR